MTPAERDWWRLWRTAQFDAEAECCAMRERARRLQAEIFATRSAKRTRVKQEMSRGPLGGRPRGGGRARGGGVARIAAALTSAALALSYAVDLLGLDLLVEQEAAAAAGGAAAAAPLALPAW